MRSATGLRNVLINSMKKLRTVSLIQSFVSLPALVLAGALCLAMTSPALAELESALADFESAVAAYEDGAYQEAQTKFEALATEFEALATEFEALATEGDERVVPYLERIRQVLDGEEQTGESFTSTLMDSVTSILMDSVTWILGESDTSSDGSESKRATRDAGSFVTSPSTESVAREKPTEWEPWSPFDQSTPTASPAATPQSDVVIPQRESIWSSLFHLPGDATVIGLQHVAQFLKADNLIRELQFISRHSEKITLSILAGFWWLAIIRVVVGIGFAINRFMIAATTTMEQKRYG